MHRIEYTNLTPEQIGAALAAAKAPTSKSPTCGCLAGKKFKISTSSDCALDFEFFDKSELSVSENGAPAVRCAYAAKTLHGVTLFTFAIPGTLRVFAVAVDFASGLATVYDTFFAGEVKMAREVQREYYFGYIDEGKGAPSKFHTLTNRFEGKGFFNVVNAAMGTLLFYILYRYVRSGDRKRDLLLLLFLFAAVFTLLPAFGLAAPAFMLPITLRFGVEKGRVAYYVLIGVTVALGLILFDSITDMNSTVGETALWIMLAAALVVFAVSWLLSVRLYETREL